MAEISEAFGTLKFQKKSFQTIDYFFTQRTLNEEHEFFDKNMNRQTKKVKVVHNFLALNIPTIVTSSNHNGNIVEKPLGFDIEIHGDEGYHYQGTITSYQGVIPNFMVPIKGDRKLFVNINYKFTDTLDNSNSSKKFVNFIEVPKRFQLTDGNNKKTETENSEED